MGRGRKPKPTVLKILAGNPGKKPLNELEPKPASHPPKCPSWLSLAAKKHWKELAPELHRLGLLTSVDGGCLAGYCQALAEFEQATRTLEEEGRYITIGAEVVMVPQPVQENGITPDPVPTMMGGHRRNHPAVSQQRTAMQKIREFSCMFGFDPSSRVKLQSVPLNQEDDDLEAFTKRA